MDKISDKGIEKLTNITNLSILWDKKSKPKLLVGGIKN
jgi:hypothetical protein